MEHMQPILDIQVELYYDCDSFYLFINISNKLLYVNSHYSNCAIVSVLLVSWRSEIAG